LDISKSNIIDVGCGVGGLSSHLALVSKSIVGIDHNNNNINTAKNIFKCKSIDYSLIGEGDMIKTKEISLSDYKSKIEFRCADPMCLPAEMSDFDIVILNDVIDKVSTPNSILGRVCGTRSLVKKQGLLVVFSAYQWNEITTPKYLWLNNNINDSNSESELILRLSNDYKLISSEKLPIFWQESQVDVKGKLYTVSIFQRM
jgi:2-polyprenyl-3-methyl-5-hydroxy-6-metoxy-1,4-benzoquinol methylase